MCSDYYAPDADMSDPAAWPRRFADGTDGRALAARMWRHLRGDSDLVRRARLFKGNVLSHDPRMEPVIRRAAAEEGYNASTARWAVNVVGIMLQGWLLK